MNLNSTTFYTQMGVDDSFIHFMLKDIGTEKKVIDVNLETGDALFFDSLGVIVAQYNLGEDVEDKHLANVMDDAWRQEGFGKTALGAFHLLLSVIGVPEFPDET